MSLTTAESFDVATYWRLSPEVSLRDEAFGALAYHHGNRRLVFLKSRELVELVRRLGDFRDVQEALNALIDGEQHERYVVALSSLAKSELLRGR
ncbi:MAG: mycofactocin biosynthesis chaperone MftB [Acidimicrobiales bacterium]